MSLVRIDVDLKRWRFGASIGFGVKFKEISIKRHGEWRGGFRINFLCFWFYCDRNGIDPSIDYLANILPTAPAKIIIKELVPIVCDFISKR